MAATKTPAQKSKTVAANVAPTRKAATTKPVMKTPAPKPGVAKKPIVKAAPPKSAAIKKPVAKTTTPKTVAAKSPVVKAASTKPVAGKKPFVKAANPRPAAGKKPVVKAAATKPAAKATTGQSASTKASPKMANPANLASPKTAAKPALTPQDIIPQTPYTYDRPAAFQVVSHSLKKVDGMGLVCGTSKYVADFDLPNLIHVKILTSPHAHARIQSIDTAEALKIPGVVAIFTHHDVPRHLHTTAGQGFPEPSPYDSVILDSKVRFVGDRVAIVAAETLEAAKEACTKIKVQYEKLPAIFDAAKARDKGAVVIHDEKDAHIPIPVFYDPKTNHVSHVTTRVGDLDKGFKQADVVLERTYQTHYAHHCPIEPHTCACYLDEQDRLVLISSTQVPFHARRIAAQALGLPIKKIRVIKPRIGGGFGGKQEVLLEDVCALVTLRTRRPCRLELTRPEEFMSSRTRHPMTVTIKMGVKKNGTLTAHSMKVLSNTGAYGSHGLTAMCNCASKVLPLYRVDNVEFIGDTVYTNLPVGGAYRGYGATQAAFAVESHMDDLAEKIGMDPIEFRRKNHIRVGETSPIFKAIGEGKAGVDMAIKSCGLEECINIGMKEIDWKKKFGNPGTSVKRRGVGMCALMQGSSIPEVDMGSVFIKMNEDGSFNMMLGATDLGTGSDTILAQIAAETIGCEHTDIIVYSSDTDFTPFDTGAYASSTTYLSGGAVINCAQKVREQILAVAAEILGEPMAGLSIENKTVLSKNRKKKLSFADICNRALYERHQFQIAAIGSHVTHASPPPFSAHFAEVEVDTETGEVKLLKYVAAVDCGTAINPQLADGQTQGGLVNGISFALTEEYIFDDNGRMLNPSFKHYKIFTANDIPEIKTFLVPTYEPTGPYGAKSVSEICINGALPAIGNAIKQAVGVRLVKPPFTAANVFQAMKELKAGKK